MSLIFSKASAKSESRTEQVERMTFDGRANRHSSNDPRYGHRGFTLVELLVVITIIGIILSLVLVAGMEAANRSNERATQSLIIKLEAGLNDRLDALRQYRPEPNFSHGYLAAVYSSAAVAVGTNPPGMLPTPYVMSGATLVVDANGNPVVNGAVRQTERAQVFAWYDFIKSEMPDVFFVQTKSPGSKDYPLNFAGVPFQNSYVLPLGNSAPGPYPAGYGDGNRTYPSLGPAGSGIYGASYSAAAGLYKNLGYLPTGFDGVDNDNDGLIDNYQEGVCDPGSSFKTQDSTIVNVVSSHLHNHVHSTARAEMLYAILVEGNGPLGSVFNRDEFTEREVADTDSDGMPEFVDAWGQPLQFFRWPLLYHSDLQRGQLIVSDATTALTWDFTPPHYDSTNTQNGMLQEREQDPLDVNQQLVAPSWWSTSGNGGIAANDSFPSALVPYTTQVPSTASYGVQAFQAFFHPLVEPSNSPTGGAQYWDRSGNYPYCRAFYTKFLILSAGQDSAPGVFLYDTTDIDTLGSTASQCLIANENSALPFGLDVFTGGAALGSVPATIAGFASNLSILFTHFSYSASVDPMHPSSSDIVQAGQDDITNHNLAAGGAIGGSG